ncbi:hypothetical protein J4429_02720 [Candidatus Pacearchaeota archaeon]|nr:hypothetical protein [Candidatus Pacearchaeota archaeon]
MRDSQKTYTADGLIVVPRNVFISPEEAIKNPSLLETTLSKMNGLGDIQRKDEELWNYFTHNERFFKENYDEGSSLATAFVTGGLFTYSLLEMTNEPKPLPKMRKETIHVFNRRVSLYPNPVDYVRDVVNRIKSENLVLFEAIELISGNFFSSEIESVTYESGAQNTYELLRLAAQSQ